MFPSEWSSYFFISRDSKEHDRQKHDQGLTSIHNACHSEYHHKRRILNELVITHDGSMGLVYLPKYIDGWFL